MQPRDEVGRRRVPARPGIDRERRAGRQRELRDSDWRMRQERRKREREKERDVCSTLAGVSDRERHAALFMRAVGFKAGILNGGRGSTGRELLGTENPNEIDCIYIYICRRTKREIYTENKFWTKNGQRKKIM